MTKSSQGSKHIEALTGLRALAAAWVFGFHLTPDISKLFPGTLADRAYSWLFSEGYLGVELFFVLSGFVLALGYGTAFREGIGIRAFVSFQRRRLARIYPNHLVTLAVVGVLVMAVPAANREAVFPNSTLQALVQHLTLTVAWTEPVTSSWNVPAWSISSEWLAYLAFPALSFLLLNRLSSRVSVVGALLLSLGLIVGVDTLMADPPSAPRMDRILFFVPGAILGMQYAGGWGRALPWAWILVVVTAALAFLLSVDALMPFKLLLPAVIYAVASDRSVLPAVLGSRPLVYLGRTSYAFYLIQLPIILIWRIFAPEPGSGILGSVMYFASVWMVNYVAAHLIWKFIEEPSRRFLTRGGA